MKTLFKLATVILLFTFLFSTKAKIVNAQHFDCSNQYGITISVTPGYYTFDNEFVLFVPETSGFDLTHEYSVDLSCVRTQTGHSKDTVEDPQIDGQEIIFTMPATSCSVITEGDHELTLKDGGNVVCKDFYHISATPCGKNNFSYVGAPNNVSPGNPVNFTFHNVGDKTFFVLLRGPSGGLGRDIGGLEMKNHNVTGSIPGELLNEGGWHSLSLSCSMGRRFKIICEGKIPVSSSPEPPPYPDATEYKPCAPIKKQWEEEKKAKYKEEFDACIACVSPPADSGKEAGVWTALGCIAIQPADFIKTLIRIGFGIGGGIAFLFMVIGVIKILTSQGNPETLNDGRGMITNAVAGLLLIIFSVIVLKIIGVDILELPGFKH